ncbi:hypothetical protein GPJ61_07100 [Brevibacillus formosus]|nr:hypothetical protein [Brevibacillus formosus]
MPRQTFLYRKKTPFCSKTCRLHRRVLRFLLMA